MCSKVPSGSREPTLQTAVTPSVTAQDLGLSKAREARKGKTTPLARQALLAYVSWAMLFPSV